MLQDSQPVEDILEAKQSIRSIILQNNISADYFELETLLLGEDIPIADKLPLYLQACVAFCDLCREVLHFLLTLFGGVSHFLLTFFLGDVSLLLVILHGIHPCGQILVALTEFFTELFSQVGKAGGELLVVGRGDNGMREARTNSCELTYGCLRTSFFMFSKA